MSRSDTSPGVEEINGTEYEYPFRVVDFHGATVFGSLDDVPPILNAEEVDRLALSLEPILRRSDHSPYDFRALKSVLRKLPDGEHGRGNLPADVDEWPGTSRLDQVEGELRNTVATIRGEADEIEDRDDVDEHLRDVIEGLRLRADEIEQTLADDQGVENGS